MMMVDDDGGWWWWWMMMMFDVEGWDDVLIPSGILLNRWLFIPVLVKKLIINIVWISSEQYYLFWKLHFM